MVAVGKVNGIGHGQYFVAVGTQLAHLLFEPGVIEKSFAKLLGILHFDQEIGNVALFQEVETLVQGGELFGPYGDVALGVAFAYETLGVGFHIASRHISTLFDDAVLDEMFKAVADFLIVERVKQCVEYFHILELHGHTEVCRGEGSVGKKVYGAFHAVVVQNVLMHFEHHTLGVEAVEIVLQEGVSLYRRLVGGAEIEARNAVGLVKTSVESAVSMRGTQEQDFDIVVVADVFYAAADMACVAHLGDGCTYPTEVAQQGQEKQVPNHGHGEE